MINELTKFESVAMSGSGRIQHEMHIAAGSRRDYFAALAMQSMIASREYIDGNWALSDIAKQSYLAADAMLAESARTAQPEPAAEWDD